MSNLAERIIAFNTSLHFEGSLPQGIRIMNPFRENPSALSASSAFYRKYYADNQARTLLLGINPGRFGAGLTGVPFTDPKRLKGVCGIDEYDGPVTHEPSSVFIYTVVERFGGPEAFFGKVYINSICPLGFTVQDSRGKEKNYNYYDREDLARAMEAFMVTTMRQQIALGLRTDRCYCLGTGKNFKAICKLNQRHAFFDKIVPLEHPRYVIQYKSRNMEQYVDKYLEALSGR